MPHSSSASRLTCRRNEPQTFLSLRPGPEAGVHRGAQVDAGEHPAGEPPRRGPPVLGCPLGRRLGCRRATRCAQPHAASKLRGATNSRSLLPGTLGRTGALAHGPNAAKPSNCGEPAAADGERTGAVDLSGNGRGRVMNRTPCKLKEPASRLPGTLGGPAHSHTVSTRRSRPTVVSLMELPLVHLVLGLGRKGKALFESEADVQTIVDPKEAAESAGLQYRDHLPEMLRTS